MIHVLFYKFQNNTNQVTSHWLWMLWEQFLLILKNLNSLFCFFLFNILRNFMPPFKWSTSQYGRFFFGHFAILDNIITWYYHTYMHIYPTMHTCMCIQQCILYSRTLCLLGSPLHCASERGHRSELEYSHFDWPKWNFFI